MNRTAVAARRVRQTGVEMTERQLDEQVRQLAKMLGLYAYHTHNAQHSEAGFPDWVFVGAAEVVYVEHKTRTGRSTPKQVEVHERLRRAGARVFVMRPEQWRDGTYSRLLQSIARGRGECRCPARNLDLFGDFGHAAGCRFHVEPGGPGEPGMANGGQRRPATPAR